MILNYVTKVMSFVFHYQIMRSLGLAGLFEYVCAISQNRSSKELYLFSFENIQNNPQNPVISGINNGIQMTKYAFKMI